MHRGDDDAETAQEEPADEEIVEFVFGADWAKATVEEVYGPPGRRHVLLRFTREVTGTLVEDGATASLPLEFVRRLAPTP